MTDPDGHALVWATQRPGRALLNSGYAAGLPPVALGAAACTEPSAALRSAAPGVGAGLV